METRTRPRDADQDREGHLRRRLLLAGRGAFQQLPGVIETAVGYEGGHVDNPTYEQVCSGTTGHVEVVPGHLRPLEGELRGAGLKFFEIHDPTQLNRQGPDVGYQYRSVIFTHSDEQAEIARRVIERVQPRFRDPIVTEVEPASRSGAPRSTTSATCRTAARAG